MKTKPTIVILGKLPPPFFGPAIATKIILNSKLSETFNLKHLNTNLNDSMNTMGERSMLKLWKVLKMYINFIPLLIGVKSKIVWIPIAQERSALLKDAVFIILSKLTGKKVVLHLRGSTLLNWYNAESKFYKLVFRYLFRTVDGAIVLGQSLKYIFEPFLPKEKIFVVPNGADYTFEEECRDYDQNNFKLLYISNLQRNKGVHNVISAINLLPSKIRENISLDVYGAWENTVFENECLQQIKNLNLPVSINKPISGKEKLRAMRLAHLLLFPPDAPEGHPWAIVEAMSAGLPIISTDQGAIIESVKDGFNGYIVPIKSPKILAERITELYNDRAKAEKMSRSSLKTYNQNFTENAMVKNLTEVFLSVNNS